MVDGRVFPSKTPNPKFPKNDVWMLLFLVTWMVACQMTPWQRGLETFTRLSGEPFALDPQLLALSSKTTLRV